MDMFRQGDVLLVKVQDGSVDLSSGKDLNDGNKVVLAEGEVTGHFHQIKSNSAQLFEIGMGIAERILVLSQDEVLVHEEHDSIQLPSGTYRVIHQREYIPGAVRMVAD